MAEAGGGFNEAIREDRFSVVHNPK